MCHPIYIREMEFQQQNTPLNLGTHRSKPNSSPLSSSKTHSLIRERLVMFSKGSLKPCEDLRFHCAFPLSKKSSLGLKSHLFIPQNLNSVFREIYIALVGRCTSENTHLCLLLQPAHPIAELSPYCMFQEQMAHQVPHC